MAKKQSFDGWLRFWPIAVVAASGLAGYVTLKSDVAGAKDDIKVIEKEQDEADKEYQALQVQQTAIQVRVDQSYELLKDLKDSVKDLKK